MPAMSLRPLPLSPSSFATPSSSTYAPCTSRCALLSPPFSARHLPTLISSHECCGRFWISIPRVLNGSLRNSRRTQLLYKAAKLSRSNVIARVTAERSDDGSAALGLEILEHREPNSRVVLSIVVPPTVCKQSYEQILMELGKKVKIPGFRPGKRIPEEILANFVGQKDVTALAVEAILKKTLPDAMASVAGRALKDTEHILTKFDELQAVFSPSSSLRYEVAVDVAPDVGWISEDAYKYLSVEVHFDDNESVAQQAADTELRTLHKDLGSLRVVTDRGIQIGDVVILDITAKRVNEDTTEGDRILSAEQKGFQLDTEESSNLLPGFVDSLVDLEKGQSRTFDLAFPATWEQEALRGIKARFTADCKELFVRVLPELDDSIAAKLHENCASLDQVKATLLKKHKLLLEKAKYDASVAAIVEQLTKIVIVDVPNSLLEDQGRQTYAMNLIQLQANGNLTKQQVASLTTQEMVYNFLRSQKAQIADAVKLSLAVAEIFRREKLKYAEEELNEEISNAIAEFKKYNEEYDEGRVREQATELLEGSKVLDWLVKHSNIKYIKSNALDDAASEQLHALA